MPSNDSTRKVNFHWSILYVQISPQIILYTFFPFKVQLIFIDASIDEDYYVPFKNNVRTLRKQ